MNIKIAIPLIFQLFILGTANLKCQVIEDKSELDQLEIDFQKQFEISTNGLLFQMASLAPKYITKENQINQNDSLRKRITTLYINYAHILTEKGFDLDFDYDKIICNRWSVLGVDDNESIEKARLQNEELCKKKRLNGAYEEFNYKFKRYYKSYYRDQGLKFIEIKELTSAFYKDKPQDNIKQVLKMLKTSA